MLPALFFLFGGKQKLNSSICSMPYLIRLPEVKQRIGLQKAAIYAHVKLGIITPSVKISTQASAWPLHEINAVVNARIAGKTDDEIRELVKELVAQRTAGEVAQ